MDLGAAQWPHPRYLLALEHVLGRSALDLGFIPRGSVSLDRLAAAGAAVRAMPAQRLDRAAPNEALRVHSVGVAAGASTPAVPLTGRIGQSHMAFLQDRLGKLHGHDARHGGGDLADLASREFAQVTDALTTCTYSEQVERELYAIAGEFAVSAGWFAFDSGSSTTAERFYNQALRLALIANDPVLHAHVLVVMAIQAVFAGRPAECTTIARAALRQKAARNSPLIAALFQARAGAGLARCGEAARSARAFARAERALDRQGTSAPVPAWLTFFGPGELTGLVAQAHLALGNYKAARGSRPTPLPRSIRNTVAIASCTRSPKPERNSVNEALTRRARPPPMPCRPRRS